MCLLALGVECHASYRLVVAANRDEFHARATAPAAWWADAPELLAGRDLEAGGTWLGVTKNGRFAAVTNYRDPSQQIQGARSRGALVSDFLTRARSAEAEAREVMARGSEFNGFNLILGDSRGIWYVSNRCPGPTRLEPGFYGLSNHLLDTPWPKVCRIRSGLEEQAKRRGAVGVEALLELLDDDHRPPDHELPDTGVGLELERLLAPARIVSPDYGTRSSTVALMGSDGDVDFVEQTRAPDGTVTGAAAYRFNVQF